MTINAALSELWTGDIWLPQVQARRIAQRGLYFLRGYAKLSEVFYNRNTPRFPLYPKHHLLYHTFYDLEASSYAHQFSFNPIVESCSQDEDFVGHVCRLSRRVGTRNIVPSAIRRYLISARTVWHHELY